jgi:hypothetical protein
MSGAHPYHGSTNSRAQRLASKLGVKPISVARLTELLNNTNRRNSTMPEVLNVDPWPDAARDPDAKLDDPTVAPFHWFRLKPDTRGRLGGVLIELLDEYPDRRRPRDFAFLAHRGWERVRADHSAGLDLQHHPEISSPLAIIVEAVRKLLVAGDVEATLRARRDAIDQQLAALAKLRGGENGHPR